MQVKMGNYLTFKVAVPVKPNFISTKVDILIWENFHYLLKQHLQSSD